MTVDTRFDEIVLALAGGAMDAQAFDYAARLGRHAGLAVTAVRQMPPRPTKSATHTALDELENLDTGLGVMTSLRVVEGRRPADVLLDFVARRRRAMLLMPTQARTPLGELLHGSVAFDIARRSAIPVLALGPKVVPITGDPPLDSILVALDGSPAAERILAPAIAFARTFTLRLALGRVLTASAGGGPQPVDRSYLATVAQSIDDEVEVFDEVTAADVAVGLVDLTSGQGSPVLAVGTRVRDARQRARTGSVAVDAVALAPHPVLVIGPQCGG